MFDTVAATEMGPVCSRMPPSGTSGHFVTASRTWSPKKKKKKTVYNVEILSKRDEIFFAAGEKKKVNLIRQISTQHRDSLFV